MSKFVVEKNKATIDWGIVIFMVIIHLVALLGFWTFSWENFAVAAFLFWLTGCVGITLTFHRLLTHRSFQVPKWFERILTTIGCLALQKTPSEWVATHRMHHAGSDTPADPHNSRRGFWHCHMDWLLHYVPEFDAPDRIARFARDINADPYYRFLDNLWVIAGIQTALGFILLAIGGWEWVIWGIAIRLVGVYHSTWFVNSASHLWGYKNYESRDNSRNNWWVALLTWGEGWHNNHHAYQHVAPAGHRWWEIDVTYMIIRLLKWVGLAKNIKTIDTYVHGDVEAGVVSV